MKALHLDSRLLPGYDKVMWTNLSIHVRFSYLYLRVLLID